MFNPQTEGGTAPIYFMNAPQMTNQALQYLQVQQMPGMQSMIQLPTHNPNHSLSQAKLGPVERAVLTQALGDHKYNRRRTQLRCETCNVSFNSQGQAETHYRGKRHARIAEIRRRKEQRGLERNGEVKAQNSEGNTESGSNSEGADPALIYMDKNGPKAENILDVFKPIKMEEKDATVVGAESNAQLHNLPPSPISDDPTVEKTVCQTSEPPTKLTLDSTIEKMIAAEKNGPLGSAGGLLGIEIREETEEEKKAREEMEAEVQKMLDNLPPYVKRVMRAIKPLDECLHCKICDVWVNSDTQMKQHLGSLRHKNTIAGIPVPPRPDKIEPVRPRSSHQYKCELCNVTLNSEVQLLQHLRSQRHKATLEGKPPKPRWVPYERFREQQRVQAKLKLQAAGYPGGTYQPIMMPQLAQMAQMGQLQGLQGMQGLHQMQGLQTLQGYPQMQGLQGMQGVQGLQGVQNMQGLTGLPPGMQFVQLM